MRDVTYDEIRKRQGYEEIQEKRVLTETEIGTLVGSFAAGGNFALSARLIDVPLSTLMRIIERTPELEERLAGGRALAIDQVERSLFTRCMGKPATATEKAVPPSDLAIIFYLKNMRADDWKDRRDVVLPGDLEAAVRRAAAEMGVSPEAVMELSKKLVEDSEDLARKKPS